MISSNRKSQIIKIPHYFLMRYFLGKTFKHADEMSSSQIGVNFVAYIDSL